MSIVETVDEKIRAGLRTVKREIFEELPAEARVALVKWWAREKITAKEIAPYVNLDEGQVRIILEAQH